MTLNNRTPLKTLRRLGKTRLHAILKKNGGPAKIPARFWNTDSLARTVRTYLPGGFWNRD